MTPELTMLACTLVLALVQILLPALFRTRETGTAYNVSARDGDGPPVGKITGRLRRAQANLFETLPLYAFGVPVVRTLVWCVSIAGLLMLFWAILFAS